MSSLGTEALMPSSTVVYVRQVVSPRLATRRCVTPERRVQAALSASLEAHSETSCKRTMKFPNGHDRK
jgi:hypothetical protein